MYKKLVCVTIFLLLTVSAAGSDFATEVVSYKGPFGSSPYDNPQSVLGKPTRWVYDDWDEEIYACSLVYSAWNTDPNGVKLVITIKSGAEIVVKFDHRIADDLGNPYGIDFIVFGNSFFKSNGYLTPATNMERLSLINPVSITTEPVKISVAQNSNGPWYCFANGPYGDTAFPTNAFAWDRDINDWDGELNWLKPIDPGLSLSSFGGISAADAIDLYDGSAGGTGFDLKDLDPNDYAALAVDPNSGRKWIQYIKIGYLSSSPYAGEIDGFSDVAGGGDYQHPTGDLSIDGRVDYEDVALFSNYWLTSISGPKDEAVIADIYQDGIVNFRDWALIAKNWLECTLGCE